MFTLEYAKNPVYQTEDLQCIKLDVKWQEFDEEMPFGAMPTDIYDYGRDLYQRAVNGEFGPIGAYTGVPNANAQPTTTGTQTL
jgi:hypothetical protein